MKLVLCILALSTAYTQISELDIESEFLMFKRKFMKAYMYEEAEFRQQVFTENLKLITEVNSKNLGFKLGVGPFADLTYLEFKEKYLITQSDHSEEFLDRILLLDTDYIPDSINWEALGKVSSVKDQLECSSSYIFAAVGSIESTRAIVFWSSVQSLSVQEELDCMEVDGSTENQGCEGGKPYSVYDFLLTNECLATEKKYPYHGKIEKCERRKYKKDCTLGILDDWKAVMPNDELQLTAAVAEGPVSASVFVGPYMQHYSSGVFTNQFCSDDNLPTSSVLITGYEMVNSTTYWIAKNSWGTDWGMGGYFLVQRDPENTSSPGACGIAYEPSYPIIL